MLCLQVLAEPIDLPCLCVFGGTAERVQICYSLFHTRAHKPDQYAIERCSTLERKDTRVRARMQKPSFLVRVRPTNAAHTNAQTRRQQHTHTQYASKECSPNTHAHRSRETEREAGMRVHIPHLVSHDSKFRLLVQKRAALLPLFSQIQTQNYTHRHFLCYTHK